MALEANGQRFCKVVHIENGRMTSRRIHTMVVQAADGRMHHLTGAQLPDSISLLTGVPYQGAHTAEVLLNPKSAPGIPLLPRPTRGLGMRDALFLVLGMFSFWLIVSLAERTARSLAGF